MTAPDFRLDFSPLRRTRERNELSLRQLALAAGCHHITLWSLENGRIQRPSLRLILRLQRSLGVPAAEIYHVEEVHDGITSYRP